MDKPHKLHLIAIGMPGDDDDAPGQFFTEKWFKLWEFYQTLHKHAPDHLRVAFCTVQEPENAGLSIYAPPPTEEPAAKELTNGLQELDRASALAKTIRWYL